MFASGPITSWQIDGETVEQWLTIFGGSKITADGDCSHEIKRCLLLGRKVVTNLDSILKSRDFALPTKVHLVDDAIQPSHPLLPPSPAFNLSQHQVLFQRVSYSHQVAKVLEFQVNQSFQRIFRIDFLRMDWFDLLVVQETLRSLQYHSFKASIWLSVFFIVQLSHTYVTTGKTIALTIRIFVSKAMALLFTML